MSHATSSLLLCVGLTLAVTLFPFDFQTPAATIAASAPAIAPRATVIAREAALNLLLFVPFGVLCCGYLASRRGSAVRQTMTAAFLLSGAIEVVQAFLPRRDPSLLDLAANTAGATAGAQWWSHWGGALADRWRRRRPRLSVALLAAVLVAYTAVGLLLSASLQRNARLQGWNASFPLLVGNELTGERPWRGRLYRFELTDEAISPAVMQRFAGEGSLQFPRPPIAAFDFASGPPYRDAAERVPTLEWTQAWEGGRATGAVSLPGVPWMRTAGAVPTIATRVERSGAFTLHLDCATDDQLQFGPARIVSNSISIGVRNFTVGQAGPDLVVRLRMPHTGPNGSRPEILVPDVFATRERRRILVSYDGGVLRAAVAGGRVHRADFSPGSSLAAAMTSLPLEGDDLQALEAMYVAGLFVVGGLLTRMFSSSPRVAALAAFVWVPSFAWLLEAALLLSSGRELRAVNVLVNIAVGSVVLSAVAFERRPSLSREAAPCTS